MTPLQLKLVQETFAKIEGDTEQFSTLFYERLFQIDPSTEPLFRSDITLQHAKFMKVLAEVIKLHLHSLISLPVTAGAKGVSLIPGAYWSGRFHHELGVTPHQFETMKTALLYALERALGPDFTAEIGEAWGHAYDILSLGMQKGMHGGEAGTAEVSREGHHNEREANELSALFTRLNGR